MPVPALVNKPKLSLLAWEVSVAFKTLSDGRTSSEASPNPITLTEIKAYLDLFGPVSLQVDVFVDVLQRMDRKFVELVTERLKRSLKGRGRKT